MAHVTQNTLEIYVAKYQLTLSTCNINLSILTSFDIYKYMYLVVHVC